MQLSALNGGSPGASAVPPPFGGGDDGPIQRQEAGNGDGGSGGSSGGASGSSGGGNSGSGNSGGNSGPPIIGYSENGDPQYGSQPSSHTPPAQNNSSTSDFTVSESGTDADGNNVTDGDIEEYNRGTQFGPIFDGIDVPKEDPITALGAYPAGESTRIETGVNTLQTNKKEAETQEEKETASKGAAAVPAAEEESLETRSKVITVHSAANNPANQPDTSLASAKGPTEKAVNDFNFPSDPDNLTGQARTDLINDVRGGMQSVDGAKAKTDTTFQTLAEVTTETPISPGTLTTEIEGHTATPDLNLAENPFDALTEAHADFSGVMEVVNRELGGTETWETVLANDEDTAISVLIKDDLAQLTGENGPLNYDLATLQAEIDAKEAALQTKVHGTEGLEGMKKQGMDEERTDHLSSARTNQGLLKDAYVNLWEGLVTDVTTEYTTAQGIVSGQLSALQTKFNGLDGAIDGAIAKFKQAADDDFDSNISGGGGLSIIDSGDVSAEWNRPDFIANLEEIIQEYNKAVDDTVTACKTAINTAKANIDTKVTDYETLNGPLGGVVAAKIEAIQEDLTELETGVDTKATELRTELGTARQEAIDEVDQYIADLANPWATLLETILDILATGGKAALWLLLKTFGVSNPDAIIAELERAAGIIGKILEDPGQFARNLVTAIKETFTEYFQPTNFGANMQEIMVTWLFGKPGLEFPTDFSAGSWIKFGLEASGMEDLKDSVIGGGVALPLGLNLQLSDIVNGPGGMFRAIQRQLIAMGNPADTETTSGETTEDTEDSRTEVLEMNWDTFRAYAEQFLDSDTLNKLDQGKEIYRQLRDKEFNTLVSDLMAEMGDEMSDIPKWIGENLVQWVQTDLFPQIPIILAQFALPGGGMAKAVKAIVDGVIWFIDNRERIWDVISTIFGALPKIANGDIPGAKADITAGINQGIGMLLDLFTEMIGTSPSDKLGDMVDSLTTKIGAGFNKLLDKITTAVQNFIHSMQEMFLGKHKNKGTGTGTGTGEGENDEETTAVEKDYQGIPIPNEQNIQSAIDSLQSAVDNAAPLPMDDDISYGTTYRLKKKTYKVLQGLADVYSRDNSYFEDGDTMTEEKAKELAGIIKGKHRVFKEFKVVDDDDVVGGANFDAPEDTEYWAWEWSASPKKNSALGKRKLDELYLAGDQDEGDHTEDQPDFEPEYVDPAVDIKPERIDSVLLQTIMYNWVVEKEGLCNGFQFTERYPIWLTTDQRFTRSKFRNLFENGVDENGQVIQMARKPNTISTQANYTGKNGFNYKNVSYMRDSLANIDFSSPHGSPTAWTNPEKSGSTVNLNDGSTNHRWGIMPSGKKVEIPKASRSQHFAIGDRLYPSHNRAGQLTWHHLSSEYEMILVDMTVHAKHGHNGGVYVWK